MPIADLWFVYHARAGDRRAWDKLFARHVPRVYNLLRRLGASSFEAEDLAQETFVTAFRALPTWRGTGAFASWLCGIAVNAYRNHFRAHERESGDESVEETTLIAPNSDPLAHATKAEGARALHTAIALLPPSCREAFVLVYVEQFSYKETASLLDVPVGTIQSRLNRAKQLLHTRLSDYFADAVTTVPAATKSPKGANIHVL